MFSLLDEYKRCFVNVENVYHYLVINMVWFMVHIHNPYVVASLQGDVSKHFQAEIKAVFIYITMPSMSI